MSVTFSARMDELPVLQETVEAPERADAARNREKVLAAAERLFAERGATCVSMEAVAAAAGVGKGTLFRRFGDRAGLAAALLSERERQLQEDLIRGPAPLGPGAPPVERLAAFGKRLLEHFAEHGDLIAVSEADGARYRSAPYAAYRAHVSMLLREAAPDADWEYMADALLAGLAADHVSYLLAVRGMTRERLAAGWAELVRRTLSDR